MVPLGEAGLILLRIPVAHRTPSVVRLMRLYQEELTPEHARDQVACVARWFAREEPGRPRCRCGKPAPLTCSLCVHCLAQSE